MAKSFADPLARQSAGLTVGPDRRVTPALVGRYEADVHARLLAIKGREMRGVRLGWENGRDLVALRERLRGDFGRVLSEEFPHWSKSSAYDFMAFFECFPDIGAIEGLSMTTVRLLIRSTTPDEAKAQILESVAEGTPVTWKEAQAIIEQERLALLPPALDLDESIAHIWRVLKQGVGPLIHESDEDQLARLNALRAPPSYEKQLDPDQRLDAATFRQAWEVVRNELQGRIEQAARKRALASGTPAAAGVPNPATAGTATEDPAIGQDARVSQPPGAKPLPARAAGSMPHNAPAERGAECPDLPEELAAAGWEVREIAPGAGRWYGYRPRWGDLAAKSTPTFTEGKPLVDAIRALMGDGAAFAGAGDAQPGCKMEQVVTLSVRLGALVALRKVLTGMVAGGMPADEQAALREAVDAALGEAGWRDGRLHD